MKRVVSLIATCVLAMCITVMPVAASSLDDVVNSQQTEAPTETPTETQQPVDDNTDITGSNLTTGNAQIINEIKSANNLDGTSSGASKINLGIKKVASFIVQVISYFITAFLVVRILLDICYIVLPFTRKWLANGYMGNVQAGVGMADGAGMGMNGMNGMGGMGMRGGMGMNGMGMGGMGMGRGMGMRGGMNGMGMSGQGMQGANPLPGRIQWVSTAALNAVAAESCGGVDGVPDSPLKVYVKDMVPVLILTPILLVLAITGALQNLGFLIGDLLANAISQAGGML